MGEKRKNIELMMEREKAARENVEKHLLEEEENRQKFEEQINNKINIIFLFIKNSSIIY